MPAFAPRERRRTRRKVEEEIVETTRRREHAVRTLDFDAYQHLTEEIDDLIAESRELIDEIE